MRKRKSSEAGQALAEFGVALPILTMLVLGIIEVGYAFFQTLVITSMARESSNLISRQVTISQTEAALQVMSNLVRFDTDTAAIVSVVRLGVSGSNQDEPIIVQRHTLGGFSGSSVFGDPPQSSYAGAPDYAAVDPEDDWSIRVAGAMPNGLTLTAGESVYVTEIFTRRRSIVPFLPLPAALYASAIF